MEAMEETIQRIRDDFEDAERDKRKKLNYVMGVIILWNIVFLNFIILPKSEPRALSESEWRLLQLNLSFFSAFLVFIVFHIEADFLQVLNYLGFYTLFVSLILPEYHLPKEIYIPSWLLASGIYIMIGITMNSIPFLLYPHRWEAIRKIHQRPPQPILPPTTGTPQRMLKLANVQETFLQGSKASEKSF
jgi:hypothetical protein